MWLTNCMECHHACTKAQTLSNTRMHMNDYDIVFGQNLIVAGWVLIITLTMQN